MNLQKEFNQCRTFGHAWYETEADVKPLFGYYMWFRCERCGTIRMDTVNNNGDLGSRSYRYPEGYKYAGNISRADFRVRVLSYRKPKRVRKSA